MIFPESVWILGSPSLWPTWQSGCCQGWWWRGWQRTTMCRNRKTGNRSHPAKRDAFVLLCLKKIYHLLWIVLECEECGVDEHQPADHPHDHQPVTKHRVIEVEHLGWFSLGCVVITTGWSLFWTFAILLSEMHLMQILRGIKQFDWNLNLSLDWGLTVTFPGSK